jgi:hypothetical protein
MPFVVLALRDALRIVCMQLGDGAAFPVAEGDFGQAIVAALAVGR